MDVQYEPDPSWSGSALSFSPVEMDFSNYQDLLVAYDELQASTGSFDQNVSQPIKRSAELNSEDEQLRIKRARNTKSARKSRERKQQAMEQLKEENKALRAQLEEARVALTAAHIQSSNTSLQSPSRSSAITTLDVASNPVDDSLNAVDGCQFGLDEEDLRCLEPGSPLTDKVINAALHLLGSLAPLTIITVDSSAHEITLPEWLHPEDRNNKQTILVPIHILPSSHWLLAIRDSNGARLLGSLPTDDHKRSAEERINTLFCRQPTCWPSSETIEEIRYTYQETDSVDSGVAVLFNAIYTVAVSLGGMQELPQVFDATLWREALMLLLRVAMGQTYNLCWAEALGGDTVLLPALHTSDEGSQLLWGPSVDPINYQDAVRTIEYQQHILFHQRERLDAAIAEKNEKKTATATQGRYIRCILDSLSQSATLQIKQVETLKIERRNSQSRLELLTKWEELSRASLFANIEDQTKDTRRHNLQKCLDKINTCLARRERMIIALGESLRAWDEALELLEEGCETR